MKTQRTHCLRRSIACSAGAVATAAAAAAAISLAATPASASSEAAPPAPSHGSEVQQQHCETNPKPKFGLEGILWTVVFGDRDTAERKDDCSSQPEGRAGGEMHGDMHGDVAGDGAAGPLQPRN
jgi:hypothetical protein